MLLPRMRQVVLAAADLDTVTASLERDLGVKAPFRDDGVGHFGLRNAVYSLGDSFVEVVSPVHGGTAVGRHLERCGGDSGYMVMLEVADATATRDRLERLGVRIVWGTTHADIVDLHLHPKDVGGALVALDITDPVGSWGWGGRADRLGHDARPHRRSAPAPEGRRRRARRARHHRPGGFVALGWRGVDGDCAD